MVWGRGGAGKLLGLGNGVLTPPNPDPDYDLHAPLELAAAVVQGLKVAALDGQVQL